MAALAAPLPAGAADGPAEEAPQQQIFRIENYRQALTLDPDNQRLRYQLGGALLRCGRPAEAVTEFRRVYPDLAESLELNFNLGLALAATDDADSALLYFEQAEALGALEQPAIYPLADAYFQLGVNFQERGDLPDARRLFSRVLALAPGRADLYRVLGEMDVHTGETDRALDEFSRYLQVYPDDEITREYVCTLHYEQALQLLEEQRPAEARAAFDRALAVSPGSPLVLYHLGRLDYAEGNFETAAERLRSALPGADAEIPSALFSLLHDCALALLEQDKLQSALAAVEPLIGRPAASAGDFGLAGDIYLALHEFAKARFCYHRALAIDPQDRSSLQNSRAADRGAIDELLARGSALRQTGKLSEALTVFNQALVIDPADPRAAAPLQQVRSELERLAADHFSTARLALAEQQPRPALQAARQGLALVPGDPEGQALAARALAALGDELAAQLAAADSLLAQGNLPEARRAYQQVLTLDPENGRAQAGLETITGQHEELTAASLRRGHQALEEGQLEIARAAFSEALRLQPDSPEGRDGLNRTEALVASLMAEEVQAARRSYSAGQMAEARDHYGKALRFRDDPTVRRELSEVEQDLADLLATLLRAARKRRAAGDFNAARTLYAQVLASFPEQKEAMEETAALNREAAASAEEQVKEVTSLLQVQEFSTAMAVCRRVLEIDPGNQQARLGLAESRAKLRDDLSRLDRRRPGCLGGGRPEWGGRSVPPGAGNRSLAVGSPGGAAAPG